MPTLQEMLASMGVPRGGGYGTPEQPIYRNQVQDRWGRSPGDPAYGQPPEGAPTHAQPPAPWLADPWQATDQGGWGQQRPPDAGGPYGGWVPPTATNERPWTSIEEYQAAHPGLPDPGPGPFPMPWGQAPAPPFGAPPGDPNAWWKLPYQQAQGQAAAAPGQVAGSAYGPPAMAAQQAAQQMGAVGGGAMPLGQFGRGGGGVWGGLGGAFGFGRRR